MSSITTPNQKQLRIFAQGTFFKGFFRENIGDFTELHNEKFNLEVTCKRLPNFINVAALLGRAPFSPGVDTVFLGS